VAGGKEASKSLAEKKSLKRGVRFRPRKRLGQHFLSDPEVILEIIRRAGFDSSDHVLEIGAGLGALTLPLAGAVRKITAVEKDARLTEMLGEKLSRGGIDNVTLINEDILKFDYNLLRCLPGEKIQVIGNLPYNISSPFLETLINNRELVSRAVLMFQFELARRLVSPPGNKAYGAITVLIRYHARISPLLEVAGTSFLPRPKVGSMVVELDFNRPHPKRAENEKLFTKVVRSAFAHRRKKILNSFRGSPMPYPDEALIKALNRCAIDPGKRAEELDIDDFLCLSAALRGNS
jgi:16S rRNA (adenine1518-N6/adenine1519-N6)-dimethyltransferase